MAISNILPRKIMRNRTRQQSVEERHDYDQKSGKTRDGELVSSYMRSSETAAEEFEISKQLYHQLTGQSQSKGREVIMYRIIQSFKPGEISPKLANQIAYELAMKFTGGRHQFKEKAAIKYGTSFKEQLRQTIDQVLPDCRSYEDFLAKMRAAGYEIKKGKQLSFRAPGQERFTRTNRLGDDYTREALRERCTVRRGSSAAPGKDFRQDSRKARSCTNRGKRSIAGCFPRTWPWG